MFVCVCMFVWVYYTVVEVSYLFHAVSGMSCGKSVFLHDKIPYWSAAVAEDSWRWCPGCVRAELIFDLEGQGLALPYSVLYTVSSHSHSGPGITEYCRVCPRYACTHNLSPKSH